MNSSFYNNRIYHIPLKLYGDYYLEISLLFDDEFRGGKFYCSPAELDPLSCLLSVVLLYGDDH